MKLFYFKTPQDIFIFLFCYVLVSAFSQLDCKALNKIANNIQKGSANLNIHLHSSLLQPIKETRFKEDKSLRSAITQECNDGICTKDEESCKQKNGEPIGKCSSQNETSSICCKLMKTEFVNECGQISMAQNDIFTSPNFPTPHNHSQVCIYVLNTFPTTCAVRVDFVEIKLKKSTKFASASGTVQKCIYDSFYIFNSHDSPSEPLCDLENFSGVFYTKKNSLPIKFLFIVQSDEWYWKFKVTQINCDSELRTWENAANCGRQLMYEPNLEENAIPVINTFIVNGMDAEGSEFPWQVSIQGPVKGHHRCGASIINERYLLSASHCFSGGGTADLEKLEIVLGNLNSTLGDERIGVERIILNYDYKPFLSHINDVAIVKLKKSIDFTNYIQPICLPEPGFKLNEDMEGIVSGYGATNGSSKVANASLVNPTHLQKLKVKIISNSECKEKISTATKSSKPEGMISKSQMCAVSMEPNSTVCFGDSGGPLIVQKDDGTFIQVGVVSYGLGRCIVNRRIPVVYSRISEFLKFIAIATM